MHMHTPRKYRKTEKAKLEKRAKNLKSKKGHFKTRAPTGCPERGGEWHAESHALGAIDTAAIPEHDESACDKMPEDNPGAAMTDNIKRKRKSTPGH